MSAISPQSSAGSWTADVPEAPGQKVNAGSVVSEAQRGGPPGSELFAAIANELLAALTKEPMNWQSREDWLRKLDELETALQKGSANSDNLLKASLARLEAQLRLTHHPDFGQESSNCEAPAVVPATLAQSTASEVERPLPLLKELSPLGATVHEGNRPSGSEQGPEPQLDHDAPRDPPTLSASPAASASELDFEALVKRIEDSHQQLAARLEDGLTAAAVQTKSIKDLIAEASSKPEPAEPKDQGTMPSAVLEWEITNFASRFDRIEENFAKLAKLDKAVEGLSAQLADVHKAAKDLSDAATEGRSGAFLKDIVSEFASIRSLNEDHWQRVQVTLREIQQSLERSDRVSDQQAPLDRLSATLSSSDPLASVRPFPSQPNEPGSLATSILSQVLSNDPSGKKSFRPSETSAASRTSVLEPNQPRSTLDGKKSEEHDTNVVNLLIEPGLGFPNRASAASPADERNPPRKAGPQSQEEEASRNDFIAAARRAARAAQKELQETANKSELSLDDAAPRLRRVSLALRSHVLQRPLILAASFLVLAASLSVLVLALNHRPSDNYLSRFFKPVEKVEAHDKSPASERTVDKTLAAQPDSQSRTLQSVSGKAAHAAQSFEASSLTQASSALPLEPSAGPSAAVSKPIAGSTEIITGSLQQAGLKSNSPQPHASASQPIQQSVPSQPNEAMANPQAEQTAAAEFQTLLGKANGGDRVAQFDLALHYAEGKNTARNYQLAAQWYGKAAQQDLALAQYRLAVLYEKGLGVGQDVREAKRLFQRAAEQGNVRAMHSLGLLAIENSDGKPNYTSAALWFGKAAEFGVRDSQYNLAVLLARGLGVPLDLVKSYTWFSIVAASGDADAAKKRDEVATRLTGSERAAADAAASSFVPHTADQGVNEAGSNLLLAADTAK